MVAGRLAVVAADDPEFWLSLRREAPELAGRLLSVRSGRDCLRAIEDPRVGLVVLDGSLGDVSGAHLVHLLHRIRANLGVVVTFEHPDPAQERELRQAGVLYYGDRRGMREIAAVLRKGMGIPDDLESGRSSKGSGPAIHRSRDARQSKRV